MSKDEQAIEAEIQAKGLNAPRLALPAGNSERITDYECGGWGTDYYTLTVADRGCVLCNDND